MSEAVPFEIGPLASGAAPGILVEHPERTRSLVDDEVRQVIAREWERTRERYSDLPAAWWRMKPTGETGGSSHEAAVRACMEAFASKLPLSEDWVVIARLDERDRLVGGGLRERQKLGSLRTDHPVVLAAGAGSRLGGGLEAARRVSSRPTSTSCSRSSPAG